MNGIELLYRIKENKIKDKTIIAVKKNNKFIFNMIYIDNDLRWENKNFRLGMLLDDKYTFDILGGIIEILKAIEIIIDEMPNIYQDVIEDIKEIIQDIRSDTKE